MASAIAAAPAGSRAGTRDGLGGSGAGAQPRLRRAGPGARRERLVPGENYRELKEQRVLSAGVPAALGGGGASHAELCAMLRELGRACGSTALALSMHTHLVASQVWLWRQGAPVGPLLERIAAEQLVLVTTSASDWLDSSGRAQRVDGGYWVTAHKHFGSGSPAGDLLLTSALYDDPTDGPTVLHFALPLRSEGITRPGQLAHHGHARLGVERHQAGRGVRPRGGREAPAGRKGAWDPFFNVVAVIVPPAGYVRLPRRRPRPRPGAGVRRGPTLLRPADRCQAALGDGRQQRLRRGRFGTSGEQGDARHRPRGLRPLAAPRRVP